MIGGIDEAGYGPKLGPMVMAWFGARTEETPEAAETVREALGRLPVNVVDSKRLFSPKKGLRALEKTALPLIGACGKTPANVGELVQALTAGFPDDVRGVPWFGGIWDRDVPFECERAEMEETAGECRAVLDAAGITALIPAAAVMSARWLNNLWRKEPNKGRASLAAFRWLSQRMLEEQGDGGGMAAVDQQGGRTNYMPWLCECFPDELPRRIRSEGNPTYELPRRKLRITVLPKAEEHCREVAAASIVAKYLREVLMRGFYEYWRERGVEPADGYGGSHGGFMQRAAAKLAEEGLGTEDVCRER